MTESVIMGIHGHLHCKAFKEEKCQTSVHRDEVVAPVLDEKKGAKTNGARKKKHPLPFGIQGGQLALRHPKPGMGHLLGTLFGQKGSTLISSPVFFAWTP